MGRITKPAYRVEYEVEGARFTPAGWDSKHAGRPNDRNLHHHVQVLQKSTEPGGVNAHLGPVRVLRAKVVKQSSGVTVARWEAGQ